MAAAGRHPPPRVIVDREFHEIGGHYHSIIGEQNALVHVSTPGRTVEEVRREFPFFETVPGQSCETGWWHFEGKEPTDQGHARALRVWQHLASLAASPLGADDGRVVVVVTHGWLYGTMMKEAAANKLVVAESAPKLGLSLGNTAISSVRIDASLATAGAPYISVEFENDLAHTANIGSLTAMLPETAKEEEQTSAA